MKLLDRIIRYTLGFVFVFSGTVKLIDPAGTAIKMKEYFEIFSTDFSSFFHYLLPFVMPLAIIICLLEVMLGWFMILNFKAKQSLNVITILLLYFGFLTFYSAYYNKVTDCGCFGDAIPLTPWESFYKDVILLILVIYLHLRKKMLEGSKGHLKQTAIGFLLLANGAIAYFGVSHLPIVDFRAYKVGVNIPDAMKPSEPYQYEYLMEKDGKEYTMQKYPSDTSYHFKEMILKNPEASPKITDFNVWNDTGDFTEQIFKGQKFLITIGNYKKTNLSSYPQLSKLLEQLPPSIEPIILTSVQEDKIDALRHEYQISVPIYFCDETVLKAMIRSNPGFLLLKNGTILGKWHYNDIPSKKQVLGLL